MKPIATRTWSEGYAYHPFSVKPTETDFPYSRRNANSSSKNAIKSCNISATWNPRLQETLINGVLQGRKQTDPKGASALSKTKMWALLLDINRLLSGNAPMDLPHTMLKELDPLAIRKQVKSETKSAALKGWDG